MSTLVSVIVPAFNVEQYLDKCVESISGQSYNDIEIVLVDDGSTDATGEMCEAMASIDDRIKVIHKKNGGLSDARNAGLREAQGQYVVFVDSDDWIENRIIETAVYEIEKKNADMIVWGYSADFVDREEQILSSRREYCSGIINKNNPKLLLEQSTIGLLGYAWNKLYRMSVLKESNAQFPKGIALVEDVVFNAQVLKFCSEVVLIDEIGTHYIQRERETLGTKHYDNLFQLKLLGCQAKESILYWFKVPEREIKGIMGSFYIAAVRATLSQIYQGKEDLDVIRRKARLFLNDKETNAILRKVVPVALRDRVLLLLFRIRCLLLLEKILRFV